MNVAGFVADRVVGYVEFCTQLHVFRHAEVPARCFVKSLVLVVVDADADGDLPLSYQINLQYGFDQVYWHTASAVLYSQVCETLIAYARSSLKRFDTVEDTTGRVLAGGVANRWNTRLKVSIVSLRSVRCSLG